MTLRPNGYRDRLIDATVDKHLQSFGAVCIQGPKWVGKTWTAENHANSEMKITDYTGPVANRDVLTSDIMKALDGENPHLIDEWQEFPKLWDIIRNDVDARPAEGKYILTGSSMPSRDSYIHSGAGRISLLTMRSMTLYETGDSDGAASLAGLFRGELDTIDCGDVELRTLVGYTVRGGWPRAVFSGKVDPRMNSDNLLEAAVEEACALDGKMRNRAKMHMLVRSLARNESTVVSDAALIGDMKKADSDTIAPETMNEYLDCLKRVHIIEETPSYKPKINSDMRIGKKPKRRFTDVSLAISALKLDEDTLMENLGTFGFMFESLCEHDLQIYAESIGGRFFHYRDGRDREIDAVVELGGKWAAFEIRLGASRIDEAAESLLSIGKIMGEKGHAPDVLCVICGMTKWAYRRPDGVFVVPITSLGP